MVGNKDRTAMWVFVAGILLLILLCVTAQGILPMILKTPHREDDVAAMMLDFMCALLAAVYLRSLKYRVEWDAVLASIISASVVTAAGLAFMTMRMLEGWCRPVSFLVSFAFVWLASSAVMWTWMIKISRKYEDPPIQGV